MQKPIKGWNEFKKELIERFQNSQTGDIYEQVMALQQNSTMSKYREEFEILTASLTDEPKIC